MAKDCTLDVDSTVTHDCFSKLGWIKHPWMRVARFVVLIGTVLLNNRGQRRSIPPTLESTLTDKDQFAVQLLDTISSQLNWDKDRLDWFVYTDGKNPSYIY